MAETGAADICLSSPPLPGDFCNGRCFEKEPLYVVLPETHPLAAEKRIKMKEMQDEDFVGFNRDTG